MIIKTLIPSDPVLFKTLLLKTHRAKRTIIYKDGSVKVEIWDASNFTPNSSLMNNISSQLWHRKDKAHIVEAVYEIIEDGGYNECDIIPLNGKYDIYIHHINGWSSFPAGEYLSEYIIDNDTITASYEIKHVRSKSVAKRISHINMRELIYIFDVALRKGELADSHTISRTVHGPLCTYDYEYCGKSGTDCSALFKDEALNNRYYDLIKKITT